ncbi:MFS transporter [Candidatus Leptofilum sp.]|uniref:MFS transporter n=1 Tax=Candidatus Leptofilum sp. TaxID=3241576 RepID=UPI003B5965CC
MEQTPSQKTSSEQVNDKQDTAVPDTFNTGQIFTIAGGHFVHDTYSAFIAPLLPLLQERLATNYTLTGSLAIFTQLPSLLNPLIGYLADRVSLRYFIILAPGITATLMSSLGIVNNYFVVAMLLLAGGVSIAAFHAPAPAMIGRMAGRRVGTGMSIFMASGELGRTFGPILAVAGVGWFGLEGMWRLMFVGWAVTAVLYYRLHEVSAKTRTKPAGLAEAWPQIRRVFPALGWIMLARAGLLTSLTTYLPLYMEDEVEVSLWLAAAALSILEGAGVAGALLSGTASDRFGRRLVLGGLFFISPLLALAFVYYPGWLAIPLLITLGLTAISPTPVMLAVVQDSFPKHRALANGIYIGLNFLVRGLGIWLVGVLADRFGLTQAFVIGAVAAFLTLPGVWFLPKRTAVVNK